MFQKFVLKLDFLLHVPYQNICDTAGGWVLFPQVYADFIHCIWINPATAVQLPFTIFNSEGTNHLNKRAAMSRGKNIKC